MNGALPPCVAGGVVCVEGTLPLCVASGPAWLRWWQLTDDSLHDCAWATYRVVGDRL